MVTNRTTNQLGLAPIRMPKTRASWMEPPPPNTEDIVGEAVARYAAGFFPMDEPGHDELPWWSVEQRWVFSLEDDALAATARTVRRSVRALGDGWAVRVDGAFETVLGWCAAPRSPGDGVWISPRLQDLYRLLHRYGWAHSFELVGPGGELGAGVLGVVVGRAAMLESMAHRIPHAGNVGLLRTLERLRDAGIELVDVQTPTDHTERLGAHPIAREEYERRLARALRRGVGSSAR